VQLRFADEQHGGSRDGCDDCRTSAGTGGHDSRGGQRQCRRVGRVRSGGRRTAGIGAAGLYDNRDRGHGHRRDSCGRVAETFDTAGHPRSTAVLQRQVRVHGGRNRPRHRHGQHGSVLQLSHERERVRRSGRRRSGHRRRAIGRHVRGVQDSSHFGYDTQRQGHHQGRQEPRQGRNSDVLAAQNQQGESNRLV